MKVAITGTPGVGKTSVSRKLAERLDLDYISLNELAREKDCIESKDEKRKTDVVDLECLQEKTSGLEDCVLDGHLSHFLDCDYVFVLRCRPVVLKERMRSKGWGEEKVRENLDAEIINVIGKEAREENENVYSIDTSDRGVEKIVDIIEDVVEGEAGSEFEKPIDWITREGVEIP